MSFNLQYILRTIICGHSSVTGAYLQLLYSLALAGAFWALSTLTVTSTKFLGRMFHMLAVMGPGGVVMYAGAFVCQDLIQGWLQLYSSSAFVVVGKSGVRCFAGLGWGGGKQATLGLWGAALNTPPPWIRQ